MTIVKVKALIGCIVFSGFAYLGSGIHYVLAVPVCDDTSVGPQEYCLESFPCPSYQEAPCNEPPVTLEDCGDTSEAIQHGSLARWNCDAMGTDTLCDWVGPVQTCFSNYACYLTEQGVCAKGITVCERIETETTENVDCAAEPSY